MSRPNNIPPEHHVARYCNAQLVRRHPVTGVFEGVHPQALELRKEERYLSTTWFEKFPGGTNSKLKGVLVALNTLLAKVKPLAAIVVLNVGKTQSCGQTRGHTIKIKPKANRKCSQYAGIWGLPADNHDLHLLASILDNKLTAREVAEIQKSTAD